MTYLSEKLAEFVVNTKYEALPEAVVHEAKRILLDSLARLRVVGEVGRGRDPLIGLGARGQQPATREEPSSLRFRGRRSP